MTPRVDRTGRWCLVVGTLLGCLAAAVVAAPESTVPKTPAPKTPISEIDEPRSGAGDEEADPRIIALSSRHRDWLRNVSVLMTETEREVFLGLDKTYRHDHFIRRFWRARDPFPATGRNELQEAWIQRVVSARDRFGDLGSERARFLLAFGPPTRVLNLSCEILRPLEIWIYSEGAEQVRGTFTVVFEGTQPLGHGRHRLWHRSQGLAALVQIGAVSATFDERRIADSISQVCIRSDEILGGLAQAIDLGSGGIEALVPPAPSDEWVETFRARSTAVAEDAQPLAAVLDLTYPGRHQTRTVVQSLVSVAVGAAEMVEQGAYSGYSFMVDGEVLRQGELFEQFRYRFDLPAAPLREAEVPLVLQRYLRPGSYTWIVKVEDLASKKVFREERTIEVPQVDGRRLAIGVGADGSLIQRPVDAEGVAGDVTQAESRPPIPLVSRLGEANAQIATGDHSIHLQRLPSVLTVGKVRVTAQARGEGIARVAFALNGQPILRKSRPPYSVELDLGDKPRLHTMSVSALDAQGQVLARDEVVVNAGPHRFSVRLIEPEPGRHYRESVRVHAEVEVPESERLDRVELFLNETRIATLYQPPFEQPILLPANGELTWVRAIAHLADGLTAEDTVFINAPDFVDRVDIQMVELFTTVVDRKRHFVEGLTADDFVVREDGEEQDVRRFELVRDLPMYAGMLLDTSLSMLEELREVEKAAYRFLETVISPRDRAAIITFNDAPTLAVRFTSNRDVLAGGLANLVAEGETALYDSMIFALHYFSGLRGKRAIVVLTDGEDSASRYRYEDVIDFARHTGVALYIIGLDLPTSEAEIRLRMRRLASETGGAFFTISGVHELARVYDAIESEVRSQYLISYQSTSSDGVGQFRRIEVEVREKGLEAKTINGYVP